MIAMVALLLLAQPSTTAEAPSAPPASQVAPAQQAAAPAQDPQDEVVCRQEVLLGSAIQQRVCETRRAVHDRAEALGEHMRRAVSSTGSRTVVITNSPTSMGGH